jgi:hypothetical protein
MIVETVKLMIYQVLDTFSERGIRDVLRSRIFWNRLATPVAMELSTFSFSPKNELIESGFKFVEVTPLYRERNLAVPLQKFLPACLKDDGCQKVYGYDWDDSLPTL